MTPKNSAQELPPVLRIEGELNIFRAAELRDLLLADPTPKTIDLAGVSAFDTAGLQLLMCAKQAALAGERTLSLVAHSPAVIEVFDLLNVASYFNDPLVMEARK